MTQTTQPILNYQNPKSHYARMDLPIGKWVLAGLACFILACFFIDQNPPEIAMGLLILVQIFNAIAFVRSAFINHHLLAAIFVFILTVIYFAYAMDRFACRCGPRPTRETKAKTDIRAMEEAIEAFKLDTGRYPTSDEGFDILVDNTSNLETWKGPYIIYRPDPWDNDYLYQYPSLLNSEGYNIVSAGPDGVINTEDDISN